MPPPDSAAPRRWPAVARVLIILAATLVFTFLAWRSSPWFSELNWMPRRFAHWADVHGVARNVVGFFGFGVLAFTFAGYRWPPVVTVSLFATVLEVVQIWIPGRRFDFKDIWASLLGLALAWLLVAGGAWIWRRRTPAR